MKCRVVGRIGVGIWKSIYIWQKFGGPIFSAHQRGPICGNEADLRPTRIGRHGGRPSNFCFLPPLNMRELARMDTIGRRHPARQDLREISNPPTIVFLTICTKSKKHEQAARIHQTPDAADRRQEHGSYRGGHQPDACWLVWLLQTRQGQRTWRHRRMDTHEIALHLEKAMRLQRPRSRQRPPTLAQPLLHRTWALLTAGSQSLGNHQSPIWSKPLTGEPDAGDLQVRFGGGSETNQCLVPTSIRHAGLFTAVNLTAVFCHVIHRPSTTVGGESTRSRSYTRPYNFIGSRSEDSFAAISESL